MASAIQEKKHDQLLRLLAGLASLPALPHWLRAQDGWAPLPEPSAVLHRIAFGSCNDQRLAQRFWNTVAASDPQLLLMLGDNVYGDASSAEMSELRDAYARLDAEPGFRRLRAEVPIIAIWDDHDYGANDAGGDFPYRQQSAAEFRSFWQIPKESPRWQRDGLYDAFTFGPPEQRVQIIVLDVRSFRSSLKPTDARGAAGKERYLPDPDPSKTMLGKAQWTWLGERLREPADLRLLISSIQVLPEGHGWERWGNLPLEREKLLELIAASKADGVVILSGDRHLGAIYQRTRDVPYPLTEITASSFNRPFRAAREQDPLLVGSLYTEANFGMIDIDWSHRRLIIELRSDDGIPVRSQTLDFARLRA